MTVEVALSGIEVAINRLRILQDVNIRAKAGSFVTLLGPSGSGKSTTLNVIAGFVEPKQGHVTFGGKDVVGLPPGARDLGIVFQNYAIFPHMTVEQNIHFALQARRNSENRDKRTAEVLDLVKLGGFQKRAANSLSGGQLQRVALARALAPRPSVLLLDEPLSALDKQLREAMQSELKTIQREVGVTTISVTHDQAEALSMSDHIIVMDHGRVVQQGTAEELYCHPRNEFLARFLGEVNLVPKAEGYNLLPSAVVDSIDADHLIVLRPEDIKLEHGKSAGQKYVTVEQVEFHGGSFRMLAKAPGVSEPLIIRSHYRGMQTLPQPGDIASISLVSERIHSVRAQSKGSRSSA